jgi:hypothetical protein
MNNNEVKNKEDFVRFVENLDEIKEVYAKAKKTLGSFFNSDFEMIRFALASGLIDLCKSDESREISSLRDELIDIRYMVDLTYQLASRLCSETVKLDRLSVVPGKLDSVLRDLDGIYTMSINSKEKESVTQRKLDKVAKKIEEIFPKEDGIIISNYFSKDKKKERAKKSTDFSEYRSNLFVDVLAPCFKEGKQEEVEEEYIDGTQIVQDMLDNMESILLTLGKKED